MNQVITDRDVKDWCVTLRHEGKSPHTILSYRVTAEQFIKAADGKADRAGIRAFMSWMDEQGRSPSTIATRLICLRVFLRWCVEEDIIDADPSTGIKPPKVKAPVVEPLSRREIEVIIRDCERQRDKAILAVIADSGMRVSEVAGMLVTSTDLDNGRAFIIGKGRKPRTVPLSDRACREIGRYLRRERSKSRFSDRPELWLGTRGALDRGSVSYIIRKASGTNPHHFRHSFANGWLEDGGSEGGLMSICGWSSRSMLDRYTAARKTDRALDEFRRLRR